MDKFTVRDATGSVDVEASAVAYGEALAAWVADNEVSSETIEAAINAVFDRYPGIRIPMPALLSQAVTELAATPDQHAALTKRCHEYVKGQAQAGNLFVIKGKGGGVAKDAPVKKSA
jgi:hypothetical protein